MENQDNQIIENQIKIINEISLKNKSKIANDILRLYLNLNKEYDLILLNKKFICKKIESDINEVNQAIDLLIKNKLLIYSKEEDTEHYRLNTQYFYDNNI